jgi:hypothetical protein
VGARHRVSARTRPRPPRLPRGLPQDQVPGRARVFPVATILTRMVSEPPAMPTQAVERAEDAPWWRLASVPWPSRARAGPPRVRRPAWPRRAGRGPGRRRAGGRPGRGQQGGHGPVDGGRHLRVAAAGRGRGPRSWGQRRSAEPSPAGSKAWVPVASSIAPASGTARMRRRRGGTTNASGGATASAATTTTIPASVSTSGTSTVNHATIESSTRVTSPVRRGGWRARGGRARGC